MSAGTLISVEEYSRTSYQPDRDYVDGELVERNVGDLAHSEMHGLLYSYFRRRRKHWNIAPAVELRIQLQPRLFRVPDVCVYEGQKISERVPTYPPLIWVEVLSPDDKPLEVNRKVREALAFGVPYVWVVDPETLASEVHTQGGSYELRDRVFHIEGRGIEVPLEALEED